MHRQGNKKQEVICGVCRWFKMTNITTEGECRLCAPKIGGWPTVSYDGYCGSFESLNESVEDDEPTLLKG